jgi:hypothetical protein
MAVREWMAMDFLKQYGLVVARKAGFIAIGWVLVYFISQPFRKEGDLNVLMLFAPMIGSIAGLIAGWYMATDAVEDSSLSGIVLWVILVLGTVLPMWTVEGIMAVIMPATWKLNFGGFMLLTASTLLGLATAVWHASSQE